MRIPRVRLSVQAWMVVVLACGGGLGRFAERARVQRDAVSAILRSGGRVSYDWQWNNGRPVAKGTFRWNGWIVRRLGPHYFASVTRVQLVGQGTDEILAYVGRLSRLQSLKVMASNVTDAGVANLDGLTRLQELTLANTQVSDVSVPRLKRLTGLRKLDVWQTAVNEAGIGELRRAMPSTSVIPPPWPTLARSPLIFPAGGGR